MGWHCVFFQMDLRYCTVQMLTRTHQAIRELVQASAFVELNRFFDILEVRWRQSLPGEFPAYLEAVEGHMLVDWDSQGDKALTQILKAWIDACPNAVYSALMFRGGAAWRERLSDEIGDQGAEDLKHIETDAFKAMIETAVKEYPNFKVAATTLRRVITATKNDWGAILWHDGKFHESRKYPELEILDRVGGGDGFASGLVFGFLEHNDAQKAVNYGAAHGALASTTPGDTSMGTRKEIEKLMAGGSARVVR